MRIQIIDELEKVITKILARKRIACRDQDVTSTELIVNEKGKRFTQSALSQWFYDARVAPDKGRATKSVQPSKFCSANKNRTKPVANFRECKLLGAFDHIYADNALGREGFGTHYVALGCRCSLPPGSSVAPDAQHSELRWWPLDELMQSPLVHINAKRYFEDAPANKL